MSSIRETVQDRLAFHGVNGHTDVIASVVDALENREAQVQADLLRAALDMGADEDEVLALLHRTFAHEHHDEALTFDAVLARIGILTAALAEQTNLLSDLNRRDLSVG